MQKVVNNNPHYQKRSNTAVHHRNISRNSTLKLFFFLLIYWLFHVFNSISETSFSSQALYLIPRVQGQPEHQTYFYKCDINDLKSKNPTALFCFEIALWISSYICSPKDMEFNLHMVWIIKSLSPLLTDPQICPH